jgi:hypothetical protein
MVIVQVEIEMVHENESMGIIETKHYTFAQPPDGLLLDRLV